MNEFYEYRRIRVAPRSWRRVGSALHERSEAVRAAGGTLYGVFTGQIGLGANEGVVLTAWPDPAGIGEGRVVVEGVDEVLESRVERLAATVRPTEPTPPSEPGVYAFRFFEIRDESWPEFLELSDGAWPSFERTNGVRVHGFWRDGESHGLPARIYVIEAPADTASR